jgi:hypothetical protein
MWFVLLALGGLVGVAALAHKAGAVASGQPSDAALTQLKFIKDVVLRTAAGNPAYMVSAAERQQAVDFARANGLPKTGTAILIQSTAFPADETWPGTNMSAAAYLTSQLAANPFRA